LTGSLLSAATAAATGAALTVSTGLARCGNGATRRIACAATVVSQEARAAPARAGDAALLAQLKEATALLEELTREWEGLAADGRGSGGDMAVTGLVARDNDLRASLRGFPLGDPSETTTVPRHACGDAVVAAHGATTAALIKAELARAEWEVRSSQVLQASSFNLTSSLVNIALLRLRLFDIDGSYEKLQDAVASGGADARLGLLTRYTAQLKAPRHADFLLECADRGPGNASRALLDKMRAVFLKSSYTAKMVCAATKAGSMSEFIFVESRADKLEMGLLDSIEEANPMKPDPPGKLQVPTDLVDLVRIFLLHRVLPLARLCQLLGPDVLSLLLRLRVVQALDGDECRIVEPTEAAAAVAGNNMCCGGFFVVSNVALWPVEDDLLIATDFEQTYSAEDVEPVMYLSEDSLALASGAPRVKASSVLDVCCGSGVQGIVALRYYADSATFVDLNPRALRFVRFNLALNGLSHKATGMYTGSVYDALPVDAGPYDAIVANPPFVPNPYGIASGGGAMYGNGGNTGEEVLAAIVQGAHKMLKPGGRLSTVTMAPNVEGLPGRIEGWYAAGTGTSTASFDALVFRGKPTPAGQYLPTSTSVETHRYQEALRDVGMETISEVVAVIMAGGSGGPNAQLAGEPRPDLWSDQVFLRTVVQNTAADTVGAAAAPASQRQPPPQQTQRAAPAAAPAQRPVDNRGREGCLPGFQPGFFPGYATGPSPGWEETSSELERIALAMAQPPLRAQR